MHLNHLCQIGLILFFASCLLPACTDNSATPVGLRVAGTIYPSPDGKYLALNAVPAQHGNYNANYGTAIVGSLDGRSVTSDVFQSGRTSREVVLGWVNNKSSSVAAVIFPGPDFAGRSGSTTVAIINTDGRKRSVTSWRDARPDVVPASNLSNGDTNAFSLTIDGTAILCPGTEIGTVQRQINEAGSETRSLRRLPIESNGIYCIDLLSGNLNKVADLPSGWWYVSGGGHYFRSMASFEGTCVAEQALSHKLGIFRVQRSHAVVFVSRLRPAVYYATADVSSDGSTVVAGRDINDSDQFEMYVATIGSPVAYSRGHVASDERYLEASNRNGKRIAVANRTGIWAGLAPFDEFAELSQIHIADYFYDGASGWSFDGKQLYVAGDGKIWRILSTDLSSAKCFKMSLTD